MDDSVVNSKLAAVVVDDEHTNAATTTVVGLGQALEKLALIEDTKTLLDITRLSHGNDAAVIADVEDTVLFEDRTQHVLNID